MANVSTVKIKGLKSLENKLGKLSKDIERRVMSAVEQSVVTMQSEAISKAPSLGGAIEREGGTIKSPFNLAGSVDVDLNAKNLSGTVSVQGSEELKYWASYTNFGTGGDAASYLGPLSGEWKTMAKQFIKNGDGRILHNGWFTDPALKMEDESVSVMKEKLKDIKL